MTEFNLHVNGQVIPVDSPDTDMPLLYALRNDCGLHGPHFGCGLGQCGACTVLVDGAATRSCVYPVGSAEGQKITTLEGVTAAGPHPLQRAFIEMQAFQCGYCANGMVMTSVALLASNPKPTEVEVREALAMNLCRCGCHTRIVKAVMSVAAKGGTQ